MNEEVKTILEKLGMCLLIALLVTVFHDTRCACLDHGKRTPYNTGWLLDERPEENKHPYDEVFHIAKDGSITIGGTLVITPSQKGATFEIDAQRGLIAYDSKEEPPKAPDIQTVSTGGFVAQPVIWFDAAHGKLMVGVEELK